MKRWTTCLIATILVCGFVASAAWADNIQSIPEYNGTKSFLNPGPFQPLTTVGTFNILPGDAAITISGTFGNSVIRNTSPLNLYLGSLQIAQCAVGATCTQGGHVPTPWSFSLTASEIASLGTGSVDFDVRQTAQFVIRLGVTTLDQVQGTSVPEPASALLLAGGLLLLGVATIRRRAIG